MKLYDSLFEDLKPLFNAEPNLSFTSDSAWAKGDPNELIFRSDAAFELGGQGKEAIAGTFFTSDSNYVGDEGILVYGPDIKDLKGDSSYARIALIEVDDSKMGEGKEIYSSIRKIDYVRYHVSLKGMMFRFSPLSSKESIVISKKAADNRLSFKDIGTHFINGFKALPQVKKVKMIFITDPNFDYQELARISNKAEDITKALDHLLGKVKMDCHSCALQKVCAEVETLCEEEFGKKN